jgi:hypothetical protein
MKYKQRAQQKNGPRRVARGDKWPMIEQRFPELDDRIIY